MEYASCCLCSNEFCENLCIPKVLECGHSMCSSCVAELLKDGKSCPECGVNLSKSLDVVPTNFSLMKLSSAFKDFECSELHLFCSLGKKKALLESKQKLLQQNIEESTSLKNIGKDELAKVSEFLIRYKNYANHSDEAKALINEIDNHLEKVDKILHRNCQLKPEKILSSSQYKNNKHFLFDVIVRLNNNEKIYACESIGFLGWRYGELTIDEEYIYFHCLASLTAEKNATLVLLKDLNRCIESPREISLFINVGKRKMLFSLTENCPLLTLQMIKWCTGDDGLMLKGLPVIVCNYEQQKNISSFENFDGVLYARENINSVSITSTSFNIENITNTKEKNNTSGVKESSGILDLCVIKMPIKRNSGGYERALMKPQSLMIYKDDVILQCSNDMIYIRRVFENEKNQRFYNVVGTIIDGDDGSNFEHMVGEKVTDCGICYEI